MTKIGSFCDGVNTSWIFSFDNSLLKLLVTLCIFSIKSNLSLSSFSDLPSILAISKMFCSSSSNLFAFLMIMSRSSMSSLLTLPLLSLTPPLLLFRRISAKPNIGWIGARNSWAAILMNSSFNRSLFLSCSFAASSFHVKAWWFSIKSLTDAIMELKDSVRTESSSLPFCLTDTS